MYGIQKSVYENLINYFFEHPGITQVTLFGSRAKKTARFNADIDLCIASEDFAKGHIKEDINELVGIYSCDIVFSDQLNQELRKQIEQDGIIIYRSSSKLSFHET